MARSLALAALLLLALLMAIATWAVPASSAKPLKINLNVGNVITVTTTADERMVDGDCSLREAVDAAESDTAVDACQAGNGAGDGGDTVYIPAGHYGFTSGQITLTGHITLQGSLNATTILDGQRLDRVIYIAVTSVAMLRHLDIRNGRVPFVYVGTEHEASTLEISGGGGIYNLGTATIAHIVLHNNKAGTVASGVGFARGAHGGGVHNAGDLTIMNSTLSGNIAGASIGGVWHGELICPLAGEGGAIANKGMLTLNHVTITGNRPGLYCVESHIIDEEYLDRRGEIGGLYTVDSSAQSNIKNSLIAGNDRSDCFGTLISHGNNLLQTLTDCTVEGEYLGWAPHLEPLADNGGPTLTHALNANSPAIDAGYCTDSRGITVTVDQRDEPRPQGEGCDIGAYESPYTSTFAIITTTLPHIANEPAP